MGQSEEPGTAESDSEELPESKVLDHLGLVAGMFEGLEIGERIDEHIAQDLDEREISVGQAVKALVLNGFGFVQQRLYLTPKFFERVPTERLIGEGVRPEHLNEGVLGRALDDLYEYGVTELFRGLAAHAAEKLGLTSRFAHLDATSFSFHGEYDSEDDSNESSEDGVIRVQQRWLVVYSEEAEDRARERVEKKIQSQHEEEAKAFSELAEREFACREDAEKALEEFEDELKASEFASKQVLRAAHYRLEESSSPDGKGNRLEETGEVGLARGGNARALRRAKGPASEAEEPVHRGNQ
jgi:transposase